MKVQRTLHKVKKGSSRKLYKTLKNAALENIYKRLQITSLEISTKE